MSDITSCMTALLPLTAGHGTRDTGHRNRRTHPATRHCDKANLLSLLWQRHPEASPGVPITAPLVVIHIDSQSRGPSRFGFDYVPSTHGWSYNWMGWSGPVTRLIGCHRTIMVWLAAHVFNHWFVFLKPDDACVALTMHHAALWLTGGQVTDIGTQICIYCTGASVTSTRVQSMWGERREESMEEGGAIMSWNVKDRECWRVSLFWAVLYGTWGESPKWCRF